MKLIDIYRKAIDTGMSHDPRESDLVLKDLKRAEKTYDDLKPGEQELFDRETFSNPYSDSRILYGSGEEEIRTIMVGIDIEVGEVLLAETLGRKGTPIDLILAHHPEGMAYANLYEVMNMQSDILHRFGVPINVAEGLMEARVREVERRLMPLNHTRAVDAARLLGMPFLCLHTPADNMVVTFLQRLFDESRPETLGDLVDRIRDIPEYRNAAVQGSGPKILVGSKTRTAGRIFVDMTGGTEGSKDVFSRLVSAGVNTIVGMHISEDHRKEAEKHHMNVVIAGHISSDNLGVNLLLDEITRGADLQILGCSGFTRIQRNSQPS
jgi:putative NIF3 family GTP cyclohydrolase 1 type 2